MWDYGTAARLGSDPRGYESCTEKPSGAVARTGLRRQRVPPRNAPGGHAGLSGQDRNMCSFGTETLNKI
jgi:hypothetical protein